MKQLQLHQLTFIRLFKYLKNSKAIENEKNDHIENNIRYLNLSWRGGSAVKSAHCRGLVHRSHCKGLINAFNSSPKGSDLHSALCGHPKSYSNLHTYK